LLMVSGFLVNPKVMLRAGTEESTFVFNMQARSRFLASLGMTISLFWRSMTQDAGKAFFRG